MSKPSQEAFTKQLLRERISWLLRGKICSTISPDVMHLMKKAHAEETSSSAREMLKTQIENVAMAEKRKKPVCQSPGFPTAYIKYGGCVNISDLPMCSEKSW